MHDHVHLILSLDNSLEIVTCSLVVSVDEFILINVTCKKSFVSSFRLLEVEPWEGKSCGKLSPAGNSHFKTVGIWQL